EGLSAFVSVSPLARHLRPGDGAAPGLRGASTRSLSITPGGIAPGRIARLTFTPTPCSAIRAPGQPSAMSYRVALQASARLGATATSEWKSIGGKASAAIRIRARAQGRIRAAPKGSGAFQLLSLY